MKNRYLKLVQASILVLATILVFYVFSKIGATNSNIQSQKTSETVVSKLDNPEKLTGENIENLDNILAKVKEEETLDPSKLLSSENQKADLDIANGTGKQVSEQLSNQETNYESEYEFSTSLYPYRAMLTEEEALDYDQIYNAITKLETSVSLANSLTISSVKNVMIAVFSDHPELFYINTNYTYCFTSSGKVLSVEFEYNTTASSLQTSRTKFLKAAAEIINEASALKTDLEKEKYVYEQLQKNCTYVNNSEMNQSAFSALVNKESVCAGYARAFQYILIQLNIPCYFCSGYVGTGNHAWNIVYIDGNYYNVDLSWDDALGDASQSYSYTYFNISDTAIGLDHQRRDLSVKLPECKTSLKLD